MNIQHSMNIISYKSFGGIRFNLGLLLQGQTWESQKMPLKFSIINRVFSCCNIYSCTQSFSSGNTLIHLVSSFVMYFCKKLKSLTGKTWPARWEYIKTGPPIVEIFNQWPAFNLEQCVSYAYYKYNIKGNCYN